MLIDRDTFRNSVFERDHNKCVICKENAVDAHHIVERRLFSNGGYFLDNGASLCEKHHLQAEMTTLSCNEIRKAAGIVNIVLPDHLYEDAEYDKWGNEILKSGERLQGELFNDESVQKILKAGNVLGLFTNRIKYTRTYHLSCSPGMNKNDRMMENENNLEGEYVVITEKLDGENITMYPDYIHARSIIMDSHPSRHWIKNFWAQKSYNIPKECRICGENLYAKHSIHYTKENGNELKTYFYMFSIWDDRNVCLSWKDTEEWAELLEIELVPVLYKGIYNKHIITELSKKIEASKGTMEGFVVRLAREFHYSEFKNACGKYVRANHVINNHGHWTARKVIPNELKIM